MSRIARKLARRKRRIIRRLKRTNDDKYRRYAAEAGPVIAVGVDRRVERSGRSVSRYRG